MFGYEYLKIRSQWSKQNICLTFYDEYGGWPILISRSFYLDPV